MKAPTITEFDNFEFIGDGIAHFLKRNEIGRSVNLPIYLKDQISLEDLYNRLKPVEIVKKKVIISLGQLELNYSKKPFKCIEEAIKKVINLICNKGVESIVILFPIIKPKLGEEKSVRLNRYIEYRRMFAKLAQDDRVAIWREPSQILLLCEEVANLAGIKYQRPAKGEDGALTPLTEKFNYAEKCQRYFISIKCYNEIAAAMKKELEKYNQKDHQPRSKGPLKQLFEAKPFQFTKQMEKSQGITILRRTVKTSEPMSTSTNYKSNEESQAKELTSSNPTKPDESEMGQIEVKTLAPMDLKTTNIDESEYETASEEDPLRPLNVVDSIDNTKCEVNMEPIVEAQIVSENTEDPTCVIPLKKEDQTIAAQLDSGALPNVISRKTAEDLTRLQCTKYIPLRRNVMLKLADGKIVRTMKHVIQAELYFGHIRLKIPFYVIESEQPMCIIGRLSMKVLKIQPVIEGNYAYCAPTGVTKRAMLKFLKPEEYQGATVFKFDTPKEFERETIDMIIADTKAVDWGKLEEDEKDNGPQIFMKKLKKDLEDAVKTKRIPQHEADEAYQELIQYADVFSRYPGKYTGSEVKFDFVEGNGHTKKWRGEKYKPSKKLQPAIRKAIKVMLALKLIRKSKSPYINTTAPVIKKNGDIRLCLNADELNKHLERRMTEPPLIEGIIFDKKPKWFCTLDFVAGFWQLVLAEESKKYTAFQIDGQVYEFCRLPYGLKTATSEFVDMINQVIPDDIPGVSKFVDDMLVTADTFQEVKNRLKIVLNLLRKNGLKLNPSKTELFKEKTEHLGYTLAKDEIGKQNKKIQKFEEFKKKHTKKGEFSLKDTNQILQLIGLTGLYKRFIPEYHQILAPIYRLTEKDVKFEWGNEQQEAFEKLEREYRKDFKLKPPNSNYDLRLETMPSDDAMNAVLYQEIDGIDHVIMYTSFAFKSHQKKFTIIDREMQTLVTTIHRLQMWLHGQRIHVRKDLQAIVKKFESLALTHRKAAGWITELNGYDLSYDLKVKKAKFFKLQAPELTLKSVEWTSITPYKVEFAEYYVNDLFDHLENIDQSQAEDETCRKIIETLKEEVQQNDKRQKARQESKRKKFEVSRDARGKEILYRTHEDGHRVPYLPSTLFYDTVDYLHEVYGHIGAAKLELIFKRLYFYPNAMKYIREVSNACIVCKVNKNYAMKKVMEYAQVEAYSIGDVISADLFGPVANPKKDPQYLLVAKDVFTGKVWLRPLNNIKKKTVTDAMEMIVKDIKSYDVKIRKVITDNGTQFISDHWNIMLNSHGVKVGHTTCYNPQSSLVERTMRIIGDKLRIKLNTRKYQSETHHGWHEFVQEIEEEINNTPTPYAIKPNEAWGIDDRLIGNLPTKSHKLDIRHELKNLQINEIKNEVKSTSSEIMLKNKLEEKDLIRDKDGYVRITADGACSKNGGDDAIAGIGICFSPDTENNISERISHPELPNSNNLAELTAIITAMKIAIFNDIKKLKLLTDSNYATKAINEQIKNWETNGWKNSRKQPVRHRVLFQEITDLKKKFESIEFQHVYARRHEYTNIIADTLAKKAVYTYDLKKQKIDEMTDRQAVECLIREKRRLQRIKDEYLFNKSHGDPTPLEEGDMILLTEHKQSSFEKGTSSKLYAKRYGPYVIRRRVTSNCYLVKSKDEDECEKIVNIRQITLFLTKQQQENLQKELCLKSKINQQDIEEKIQNYLKRHQIDDLAVDTGREVEISMDKNITSDVAKEIAQKLRHERRERREKTKQDDGENEAKPSNKKFEKIRKKLKKKKSSEKVMTELEDNIRKAVITKKRFKEIEDIVNADGSPEDARNPPLSVKEARDNGVNPESTQQTGKRGRPRKTPLPIAMLDYLNKYEKQYLAIAYDELEEETK